MQKNKNNEKDTANKTEVSNNHVMKSEIEKLKKDLSEKNNRIKVLVNSINLKSRPSGLRKTTLETNSLAHITTWLSIG